MTQSAPQGISILVPSFNSGRFLREAVGSVLPQLLPDDEILIQDGGSRDGSVDALAEEFEDARIKICVEPDDGQSHALQRALARAQNQVIGWLNADDVYFPGCLDAVRTAWADDPDLDLAYGTWRILDENLGVVREVVPGEFTVERITSRKPTVFSGAMFFSRSCLIELGGFRRDLHCVMDAELFVRLAGQPNLRIAAIAQVLGGYRRQPDAKTVRVDFTVVREVYRLSRERADGPRGQVRALRHAGTMTAVVLTRPLRYSAAYGRLRWSRQQGGGPGP